MNPVVLAVSLMLILSLARVHVVFSLIISAFIGGMVADIPADTILAAFPDAGVTAPDSLLKLKYLVKIFEEGIAAGTTTALSYAVLGAFAVAISYSGLSQAMANLIIGRARHGKGASLKWLLIIALLAMSIMSQNLVPIHIAFIPLVVPPLLLVMNRLNLDRRLLACVITFGLVCTYMFIPYGFGDIFLNKILLGNINKFGMDVSGVNIYQAMAIPALGMVAGLATAIFYSYRQPRHYEDRPVEGAAEQVPVKPLNIIIALIAVTAAFLAQKYTGSLILAGLIGFAIFMVARVIRWHQADTVFNSGIRMMSMIAFIMIAANGFAAVMNASGGAAGSRQRRLLRQQPRPGSARHAGSRTFGDDGHRQLLLNPAHHRRHLRAAVRANGLLAAGHRRHHRHRRRAWRRRLTRLRLHPRPDNGL